MSNIAELFAAAWRNYVTDGVPSSGENEPSKAEIRAIGPAIDTAFDDFANLILAASIGVYETKADLDATIGDAVAGDTGAVLADGTSSNNGWYRAEGSPLAFVKFADIFDVAAAQAYIDAQIAGRQPLDATLTAIAAVTVAANKLIYATGADAFATTDLTAFARSLLDDADAATARTTLGVAIGTNVQAYDADLSALAALSGTGIAVRTASDTWAQRSLTAPAAGLTITNPAGVAGNPTFVLANDLAAVEGLSGTGIAKRSGTDTWTTLSSQAFGESLLNLADAAAAQAAIGADLTLYKAKRAVDTLGTLSGTYLNYTADAVSGKAIDTSGAEVSAVGRYATGLIEVSATTAITRMGSPVTSGSYVPFAFYDAAKAFLGYAWASADVTIYAISDAPAGTKYVRLTATNSTVEYYIYEPGLIAREKDKIFSLYGTPIDNAGNLSAQYVNKTTGAVANSSSFRMTAALPVGPTSYVACGGGLISNTDTTQCQIAFYDDAASPPFLGYYNPVAVNQPVRIADHFPTATSVRVTYDVGATGPVHVINSGGMYDLVMDMVATGAIVDYFAPSLVTAKRLNLSGGTTQAGHAYWRTTDYIPAVEGQAWYYSGQDVSSLGACIAGYDANKIFVENLLVGSTGADFLNYRVATPAGISFIRATYRNDVAPFALLSVRAAQALQEGSAADVVYLPPSEVYGRVGSPMFVMARGIVGDRSVPVAFAPDTGTFDEFYGVEKLRVRKDSDDPENPATIKVQAAVGTKTTNISTISLRLSDPGALVSPTVPLNVVWIGDSLTSQLATGDGDSIDGDGTCVNECCRQLTGVGLQALTPDVAKLTISAPFVTGNSISGTITDGVTPKTVGPVAFDTNSDTTLSALASAIQSKLLEYTAAAGSTATRSGSSDILVSLKTPITFSGFTVTGGASQATFSDTFTPFSGGPEVNTGREWGPVVDGDIRAPLSLTNIHFRGTRGTGTIKHEGRGGWHPISYLERTDVVGGDGKFNAFWDPGLTPWGPVGTTWQFSMKYYIENNGWDVGSVASGVVEDGSNLLVIIELGWNDYGNDTGAGPSATYMAAIMDQINLEYPGATVWVLGMQAPMENIFQSNASDTVEKYYTAATVFRDAVHAYGTAYRAICNDRGYSRFIQTSHQIDPDYAFSRAVRSFGPNTTDSSYSAGTVAGTASIVHMRRRGYDALARIVADAILYHFCR